MTFPPQGPPPGPPPGWSPGPLQPPGPIQPPYGYEPPTQQIPQPPAAPPPVPPVSPAPPVFPEDSEPRRRGPLRDPLSAVLILVIVTAVALAALLGGELFARNKADSIVANAVSCVVRDSATASFGPRPFLIQHFTRSYRNMTVETAGNQIREAKGMKLKLLLDDVRINPTAESAGTLGVLDADITWSADGIKQTVQGVIPVLGNLVSGVNPEPSTGTLELQGPLGTVTIRPQVADGGLNLEVMKVTGLGFTLPRESVQPALDAFTSTLTDNLPMGIRADSVEVTDSGISARFMTRDATIPNGQQDPCFAGI